jgi:acetyl-CoA carboxylase biotin carboxyl carrier protein
VDYQDIRKLVELMDEHGLSHFDLSRKDFHLKLKKGVDADDLHALLAGLPSAARAVPAAQPSAAPGAAPAPAESPAAPAGSEITSPMVGTFYVRSGPEVAPFVNVGDTVSVGQTLCIIEAMKVMNEIKAEISGTISAIVAEDGAPVQYGDVLFRVQ